MVLVKNISRRAINVDGKQIQPGETKQVSEGGYLTKFIENKFLELVKEEKKIKENTRKKVKKGLMVETPKLEYMEDN